MLHGIDIHDRYKNPNCLIIMAGLFGGPPPSTVEATEEEVEALNQSRKKVRKEGSVFSGEVLLKPQIEDWMEEENSKVE